MKNEELYEMFPISKRWGNAEIPTTIYMHVIRNPNGYWEVAGPFASKEEAEAFFVAPKHHPKAPNDWPDAKVYARSAEYILDPKTLEVE